MQGCLGILVGVQSLNMSQAFWSPKREDCPLLFGPLSVSLEIRSFDYLSTPLMITAVTIEQLAISTVSKVGCSKSWC